MSSAVASPPARHLLLEIVALASAAVFGVHCAPSTKPTVTPSAKKATIDLSIAASGATAAKGAKAKLAEAEICPVSVTRKKPDFEATSLRALLEKLKRPNHQTRFHEAPENPEPNASDLDLTLPTLVQTEMKGMTWVKTVFLLAKSKKKFFAVAVGSQQGGQCAGEVTFEFVGTERSIHVRGTEVVRNFRSLCDEPNGTSHECGPDDEGLALPRSGGCFVDYVVERDVILDGDAFVSFERPGLNDEADMTEAKTETKTEPVAITIEPTGVRLTGRGCNEIVLFGASPNAKGATPTSK